EIFPHPSDAPYVAYKYKIRNRVFVDDGGNACHFDNKGTEDLVSFDDLSVFYHACCKVEIRRFLPNINRSFAFRQ
ncbi:MAG TPA: hypothetical protein VK809_09300, partial [Bacteroidia bacterium]|nr:hypothetical protein [Bacteroidia bacterium]